MTPIRIYMLFPKKNSRQRMSTAVTGRAHCQHQVAFLKFDMMKFVSVCSCGPPQGHLCTTLYVHEASAPFAALCTTFGVIHHGAQFHAGALSFGAKFIHVCISQDNADF